MSKAQREKGKRGEREFASKCREYGYSEVKRGQQYSGIGGADVVGLPHIHVEVKRQENVSLEAALRQARDDAKSKPAIVAHRKNRGRWRITMDIDDFFTMYREFEASLTMAEIEREG